MRTFLIRLAIENLGDQEHGVVITFDDMTELQAAQRKAAWSDVARRIAHEIKNPLTPIQLSAERLKKRYLAQIKDDPETFIQCTDTIIKHVGDIGHMVNEFSAFARMPEPVLHKASVSRQIKDALILHKQAHGDVKIDFRAEDGEKFEALMDAQQIRQAVNNLLQNAIDSVHMRIEEEGKKAKKGQIDVVLGRSGKDQVFIAVTDNGQGFPAGAVKDKLTDPYVTHKAKGTGLGLAIVKKIMEDHNGDIRLGAPEWLLKHPQWVDLSGACVVLTLPALDKTAKRVA
jgi:two-component system nitrogen regulation sensor histidine kinase NtrY